MYGVACETNLQEDGERMFEAVAWGWAADSKQGNYGKSELFLEDTRASVHVLPPDGDTLPI